MFTFLSKIESWRQQIVPSYIFAYFLTVNLILYIERGIIPGSNREFVTFIKTTINPEKPDVYVGLLQSAFLAGLSLSSPFVGHFVSKYNPKLILLISLIIWQFSVLGTAVSGWIENYYLLVSSRVLSGLGEAAFISFVPTYIMKHGGQYQGRWLAIFFFMLPLGAAIGFGYGAFISNSSLGWPMAFLLIDILSVFLIVFFMTVPNKQFESKDTSKLGDKTDLNLSSINHFESPDKSSTDDASKLDPTKPIKDNLPHRGVLTFLSQFKAISSSPTYWCMLGNAASYAASIISLQTFISAFVLELGFLESETFASILLGGVVSISGILGTLLGGFIADYTCNYKPNESNHNQNLDYKKSNTSVSLAENYFNLNKFQNIANLSIVACILSLLGSMFMITFAFMPSLITFLVVPFLGLIFIFSTVAFNSLLLMLSVPIVNRPFAISISVLFQHLLGDVPAQIIVGYIKDALAPNCILQEGQAIVSDKCFDENSGIRITILIISSWFLWMVLTFLVTWLFALYDIRKISRILPSSLLPSSN